jgi:hypothetical protein
VAQQGKPTSRRALDGFGAPPWVGCPGAAVPDANSFVGPGASVSPVTGPMLDVAPNRDLTGRRTVPSPGRHVGGTPLILVAAAVAEDPVTVCAVGAAEHPIVALSAASTSEVIDRQYRAIGCCPQTGGAASRCCSVAGGRTRGRASRWWSVVGGQTGGGASRGSARIGVDMPQLCAVAVGRRPVASADPAPDTASARLTTGADAA